MMTSTSAAGSLKMQDYSLLNALLYEVLTVLIEIWPNLKLNPVINKTLAWCKVDWIEWKTNKTLKDVDKQAEKIVEDWDKQEKPSYEFIEHKPDGSEAQELLGGTIEMKSTWKRE